MKTENLYKVAFFLPLNEPLTNSLTKSKKAKPRSQVGLYIFVGKKIG